MERRVRFIGKIGILKEVRVIADDAFDQKDVVEENGSSETSGGFDPDASLADGGLGFGGCRTLYRGCHCCYRCSIARVVLKSSGR